MKKLVGLIGVMMTLSGCAADIIKARDFLASPQTQVAAGVLVSAARAGATIVSCFVGAGSGIALAVEQQAATKGQYATGIIYAASSKVCTALQGQTTGTVIAAGGEAVVTAAAPATN